jgi:hypothetical protein
MSLLMITAFIYNYFSKYRYFKILEAITYRFNDGKNFTKDFMNCRIKILTKRPPADLMIDELWIEHRLYKIRITDEENQLIENCFPEKQALYIDVESEMDYADGQVFPAENLKSKIFLGYMVRSKRVYLLINSVSELVPRRSVA